MPFCKECQTPVHSIHARGQSDGSFLCTRCIVFLITRGHPRNIWDYAGFFLFGLTVFACLLALKISVVMTLAIGWIGTWIAIFLRDGGDRLRMSSLDRAMLDMIQSQRKLRLIPEETKKEKEHPDLIAVASG
ncbi:MAG: hypothetical protein WC859_01395 [Elusimicrobiota bacterium]|jgi:hypothetical protein